MEEKDKGGCDPSGRSYAAWEYGGGTDACDRRKRYLHKSMMNTLYKSIAGISSVTAGCVAGICLYLMFFSKNRNTVEESIAWLKRIAVCWIAIMLMASIIYFVTTNLGIGDNASLY